MPENGLKGPHRWGLICQGCLPGEGSWPGGRAPQAPQMHLHPSLSLSGLHLGQRVGGASPRHCMARAARFLPQQAAVPENLGTGGGRGPTGLPTQGSGPCLLNGACRVPRAVAWSCGLGLWPGVGPGAVAWGCSLGLWPGAGPQGGEGWAGPAQGGVCAGGGPEGQVSGARQVLDTGLPWSSRDKTVLPTRAATCEGSACPGSTCFLPVPLTGDTQPWAWATGQCSIH